VAYFINVTLTNCLKRLGLNFGYCILDNASNQCTDLVHECLATLFFEDQYEHLPPYSPFLAPIEHGFANVRSYIKQHEADSYHDPIGLIDRAFCEYSVTGSRGYTAANHFRCYEINHEQWVKDIRGENV
jgi:hypothetical protein